MSPATGATPCQESKHRHLPETEFDKRVRKHIDAWEYEKDGQKRLVVAVQTFTCNSEPVQQIDEVYICTRPPCPR